MARQDRALRTRRAIFEGAATVFDERGYESTTISEILERAEVTRGAFYFHFPSKEDLARHVLAAAVTTDGVPENRLKLQQLVDTLLLLAHRMPHEPMLRAALRMSVDLESQRLFGTRWPDWTSLLADLLREACERGEIYQHVDEDETARLLVCSWTGVRVVCEGLPEEYDLAQEVAKLLHLILPAIAVPLVLAKLEVSAERAAELYAGLSLAGTEPAGARRDDEEPSERPHPNG
ncbi:ScbR family autoregulator-binding transcription factor [Streptomyces amakusaensis]|uniref:ScbR family autoregulator-binding transcription factor n=1 Tax=Streptomyces amakusaensis TaxID=67271 RepID=A0ABW0AGP4_9ACTN